MPELITSRENPVIKVARKLAQDNLAYRKLGQVWLEGDHLCRAAMARGIRPATGIFAESAWAGLSTELQQAPIRSMLIPDLLFRELSGLESPAGMGFLVNLPPQPEVVARANAVVLDRVQDAGNVGSILRSAAAFGFGQVLALKGTAALWSPKVLRAGMGAHFALQLIEGQTLENLERLSLPLVVTSSHTGTLVHQMKNMAACAWVFGHEGQGVAPELMARAALTVRIGQPGGEESLNVAAAAAICLHASSVSVRPL
jgi:RNA methyltransferase, TrmH family